MDHRLLLLWIAFIRLLSGSGCSARLGGGREALNDGENLSELGVAELGAARQVAHDRALQLGPREVVMQRDGVRPSRKAGVALLHARHTFPWSRRRSRRRSGRRRR